MRRNAHYLLLSTCFLLPAGIVGWQWARPAPARQREVRIITAPLVISADEALLDRPVDALTLDSAVLPDALAQLQRTTGVPIVCNHTLGASETAIVYEPITLSLRNVSLAGALHAVCTQAGDEVDYGVQDGLVIVGLRPAVPRQTEAFDLRGLLNEQDDAAAREAWFAPGGGGGASRGQGLFGGVFISDAERMGEILREALWLEPRAGRGSSTAPEWSTWHGHLLVREPIGTRRRVRGVIHALRQTEEPTSRPAGGLLGFTATTAPTTTAPVPSTRPSVDPDADAAEKLAEPRPELSLDNTRFDKAVETIASLWKVTIVVDWPAMRSIVDNDSPVRLHLWDVRLSQALDILLMQSSVPGSRPSYRMEEGVITISSADRLGIVGIVKVYDVRDLIDAAATYGHPLAPTTEPSTAPAASSPRLYQQPATPAAVPRTAEDVEGERLREVLESALNIERGEQQLHYWSGRLIVTALPAEHRRIETLLQKLRQTAIHLSQTSPSERAR